MASLDVNQELKKLQLLIKTLPADVPEGPSDGPIAQHFSDRVVEDEDEGPYKTVNIAYERVFQSKSAAELAKLVTRGQFGLPLVLDYMQFFAGVSGMDRGLLALRVSQVANIIKKTLEHRRTSTSNFFHPTTTKPATSNKVQPSTHAETATTPTTKKGTKRPRADRDYVPPKKSKDDSGSEQDSDSDGDASNDEDLPEVVEISRPTKKNKVIATEGADNDTPEDGVEVLAARPGRAPKKAQWAISQYTPLPVLNKKSKPVWKWACNWCPQFRTSARTKNVKKYADETIELKINSNFISHFDTCTGIPKDKTFDAVVEAEAQQKLGLSVPKMLPTAPLETTVELSSQAGSRIVLSKFVASGINNPAVEVTQKGFRERFVRAVIEDDLAFSLGEKSGIAGLLSYLIPSHYTIPKRKTVRRDLDALYKILDAELNVELKAVTSKIAVASDLWTSKNSVYAFAGVLGFWITDSWVLMECVFELLPLDGDHSGKATGKLMYHALRRREVEKKLSANTSDNASSNGEVNNALSGLIFLESNTHINTMNMEVGCAGHVINLVAQDILYGLGVMPSTDEVDLYEQTRQFDLAYRAEEDPEVLEESEAMAKELQAGESVAAAAGRHSDESDGYDSESWELPVSVEPKSSKKKPKRVATIVDKLHETITDILRSEVRRKRLRVLIRETCDPENRTLVPIRGMVIRWNTTYAEINRAVKLKPALNRWNDELSRGLTGKKKEAALLKSKELHLSPTDWDNLKRLSETLKILQNATVDLSKKGVPTICKVLPIYKTIEVHLVSAKVDASMHPDATFPLEDALQAGLKKLRTYISKALKSDYPLLGAILHPGFRTSYFQDSLEWDSAIADRGKTLLVHLYDVYSRERGHALAKPTPPTQPTKPVSSSGGIFVNSMRHSKSPEKTSKRPKTEIDKYLEGAYPFSDENPLAWYKAHGTEFPVLSAIARDVLAVPGVSISVERLFSSSKHTMSDSRSSMSASTAAKTVVLKEWLKAGLGKDISYLNGM